MFWKDNHGHIHGPYRKQEDGFPHAGEVIRFYRKKMGLTQEKLALLLDVKRLEVIRMEKYNMVPKSIERRKTIAKLLQISPILLGIGVIGEYLEPLKEVHSSVEVRTYSAEEASEYLDLSWELHRCGGSLKMLPGVQRWKARIKVDALQSGKNLELLHRYDLFLLQVGKELRNYTIADPKGMIDEAEQIDNPETLGISLVRRGKVYFEQGNYEEALKGVREALDMIGLASPQVKGMVLAGSGVVLAPLATDKTDVDKIMKNIDKAQKCVGKVKNYPDTFYTEFDEGQYYLSRAYSIIPLLRLDPTLIDEVWEALEIAKERTGPQDVRRCSTIEFRYAEASFHTENYAGAISAALDALELAQSVGNAQNIERVKKLYKKLAQTKIRDSAELRELDEALRK